MGRSCPFPCASEDQASSQAPVAEVQSVSKLPLNATPSSCDRPKLVRSCPKLVRSPVTMDIEEAPLVPGETADDYPRLGLSPKSASLGWIACCVRSKASQEPADAECAIVQKTHRRCSSIAMPESPFFPATSYASTHTLKRKPLRRVTFAASPSHEVHCSVFEIEPYSEIYGMHPRDFDFNKDGEKVPCGVQALALDDIDDDDDTMASGVTSSTW